jgi:hypothetical protein
MCTGSGARPRIARTGRDDGLSTLVMASLPVAFECLFGALVHYTRGLEDELVKVGYFVVKPVIRGEAAHDGRRTLVLCPTAHNARSLLTFDEVLF